MKSFLILSIFAIVGYVSAQSSYAVPTPAQWSAYQAAAAAANIVEKSLPFSSWVRANRFAVRIPFTDGNCRLGAANSAVAVSVTNSFTGSNCTLLSWNDIRTSCYAIANVECSTFEAFTGQLTNNTVLKFYGKTVYHHYNIDVPNVGSPRFNSRRTARQEEEGGQDEGGQDEGGQDGGAEECGEGEGEYSCFPDQPFPWGNNHEGQELNDVCLYCEGWKFLNNTEQNRLTGTLVPTSYGKNWHYAAMTQNNLPLDLNSSPTGHRYPVYAGRGKLYTIGKGLDVDHPEFSNTNERTVTVDYSLLAYPFPEGPDVSQTDRDYYAALKEEMQGDHDGHETAGVAFAAGKTLGILPKADIHLYVIIAFHVECMYWEDFYEAWSDSICIEGTGAPQEDAWRNALLNAGIDNENRRLAGNGTGVFTASYMPMYIEESDGGHYYDCIANDCMRDFLNTVRHVIARGLIVVHAAGNEGIVFTEASYLGIGKYAPIISIDEVVWVGGYDRNYQQGKYKVLGWDDTIYFANGYKSASNYGGKIDFYGPSKDFPYFAATHRANDSVLARPPMNLRPENYVPYGRWNFAEGTSYAAPIVAAGLLGYSSQIPLTVSGPEFVERALDAADKWANRVEITTWVNKSHTPITNPERVVRQFRLIPTDNAEDCPY